MNEISPEAVRAALDYNPETGVFIRRQSRASRADLFVGKPAGTRHKGHGYVVIKIGKKGYLAHRLAWVHVHGEWPSETIDHINLDKADNRICNLRLASLSQNCMNRAPFKTNKSGFKGVTYKPNIRRWVANIRIGKEQVHLGTFKNAQEAHAAYLAAAMQHHGEFARACRPPLEASEAQ